MTISPLVLMPEAADGTEIKDGDMLRFQGQTGQLTLMSDHLLLKVSATDAPAYFLRHGDS